MLSQQPVLRYDGVPEYDLKPRVDGRRRLNVWMICLMIFLPWALFSCVIAVMSFSWHYQHPSLTFFVISVGVVMVVITFLLALRARKIEKKEPTWYMFAAAMLTLALVLGCVLGDMNYVYNMLPYYENQVLNAYPSVDPAQDKGQQLMDAGSVYFVSGSRLDKSKAMSFKDLDLYCVAPITSGTAALSSYDFWAVGVNCCSGSLTDFRCGEFNMKEARAGLRLLDNENSGFFRLAVKQAESAYRIKADHPLFFTWMQDPVAAINKYKEDGFKYCLLAILAYLAFSVLVVALALFRGSKR